ncbi:putative methyltransferase [Chloropicon primus]|uniref:Ribosomal RNA-processing protein 8 n=1 Tax=Chloropicon primus TaxID=1764295 RepID=A0A5B8N0Q9_9CHLO|nr:putative methyltransferase [Chloropicon primus]UPR05031.1 putative methyltransferase [Chloropicon primus]|eukprot:QDZ25836.1 putative methyltransferase [Chloropicon primus]
MMQHHRQRHQQQQQQRRPVPVEEEDDAAAEEEELRLKEKEMKKRERNTRHQQIKRKKKKLRKDIASNLLLTVPDFESPEGEETPNAGRSGESGGDCSGREGRGKREDGNNGPGAKGGGYRDASGSKLGKSKRGKEARKGKESAGAKRNAPDAGRSKPSPRLGSEAKDSTRPKSKEETRPNGKKPNLLEKMRNRLQGSQFRWLNEKLYTCSGREAFEMMQKDDKMFDNYHLGFQTQTEHWPVRPVDVAIKFIQNRARQQHKKQGGEPLRVADFGCGDAEVSLHFSKSSSSAAVVECHSFDLVSKNPRVVACNMAKVPLESGCCDIAIFCLALMGNDYPLFLREAERCLKANGTLWIAEVRSRYSKVKGGDTRNSDFVKRICSDLNFKLLKHDNSNKMFVTYVFEKHGQGKGKANEAGKSSSPQDLVASWPKLSSCVYKKR